MFLGGTLEYAVFVAWYSRKKDKQKSKNNLCICYGKKKSASPLNLPTILHVPKPNTCLLSSIETQIITYQTCPQSQRTKNCPYIKFRYFEKKIKNNLTLCFEDWKVSFKKNVFEFCGLLTISELYCFQSPYADRDKRRFSNPDEKEVYFWNLSKGSE